MRVHLLVLLLSIYQTNVHGQHDTSSQASSSGQPHVGRKMESHVHDMDHIRHDLEGQINKPAEQMTSEEQNFYYFKLHDTNNDNCLDGLEVIAAFNHEHQDENAHNETTDGEHKSPNERIDEEELIKLIDDIFKEEDLDNDGLITYEEFKHAMEADAAADE